MASGAAELSPRAREIVAAARELLEEEGREALSMRRLAERLGIRAPSIYKHLPGKDALEAAVISAGFVELADALDGATLDELATRYRGFAHRHPHLYRLMTDGPLDRELLVPGAEDRAALPVVRAVGGDRDAARALWGVAHGMTILELDGRFPADADLDAAWRRGLQAFAAV